jgi:hypothetical protein
MTAYSASQIPKLIKIKPVLNEVHVVAKITYIEHNGTEHQIDVANGLTVM